MKRRRAAAPYAKALFALARERNQTELVGRELGDVTATFESDLNLRDFFARPWIPPPAKRTVATEVAQRSGLSTLSTGFLALLAGRGRADHLEPIAERYRELLDEDLGRVLDGFIVESGSVVLDGTLEGLLEHVRRRLAGGQEAGAHDPR